MIDGRSMRARARHTDAKPAGAALVRTPEGLGLRGSGLRFDPVRPADLAFISSPRYPRRRVRGHRRLVATAPTLALLGAEGGGLPAAFGRTFDLGGLEVELVRSGHLFGGAWIRVLTREGLEVGYVAGFRPDAGRTTGGGEVRPVDVLVLESPWRVPATGLPTRSEALARLGDRVATARRDGETPVVIVNGLGATMEALALFVDHDIPVRAERTVADRARVWHRAGAPVGVVPRLRDRIAPGEVVVLPAHMPELSVAPARPRLLPFGVTPEMQDAAAIRYADHGSDDDLVAFASSSGAREVVTFGSGAARLAARLEGAGMAARALDTATQLPLL